MEELLEHLHQLATAHGKASREWELQRNEKKSEAHALVSNEMLTLIDYVERNFVRNPSDSRSSA